MNTLSTSQRSLVNKLLLPATPDWCGKLVKIGSLLIKWAVAIPVWVRRETDVLSAGPL